MRKSHSTYTYGISVVYLANGQKVAVGSNDSRAKGMAVNAFNIIQHSYVRRRKYDAVISIVPATGLCISPLNQTKPLTLYLFYLCRPGSYFCLRGANPIIKYIFASL